MKQAASVIVFLAYAALPVSASAAEHAGLHSHAPIIINVQAGVAGGQDTLSASGMDLQQYAWAGNGEAARRQPTHEQASTPAPAAPVPEPSGSVMLIGGLLLLLLARRNDDDAVFKIARQDVENR